MRLDQERKFDLSGAVPVMLVSGEAGFAISALEALGIRVITTKRNHRLAAPVAYHPDMQFFFFPDGKAFTLQGNELSPAFKEMNISVFTTEKWPDRLYPGDVLCNAFYHAGAIYGRLSSLDSNIIAYAHERAIELIPVRQGYTACSVCAVNDEGIITADAGLGNACRVLGAHVLEIAAGSIRLPGYDYGFIGGCSGRISDKAIAFTGRLDSHPDGKRIQDFIRHYDMDVLELSDGPLVDIGGMIDIGKWYKTEA